MRAAHSEGEATNQEPGASGALPEQPPDHREVLGLPQQNETPETGETELEKRVQQNDPIGNEENPGNCELHFEDAGLADRFVCV